MAQKKHTAKKQPNPQPAKKHGGKNVPPVKEFIGNTGIPRKYLIPGVLFCLCFLLYGNTLKNGYALDDDLYTRRNVYVQQGFSDIGKIFNKGSLYGFNGNNESNYRPLVLLDFMTEVHFFGLQNPHVFHFFNILFYAICCILLYYVMQRIFKEYNKLIPLTVTLLFLFHPIHTEVVANIKSRDEILGLLFGLVSFYSVFRYTDTGKANYYVFSLSAFLASILCKEGSVMFIFIIPLLLYYFTSTGLKKIALISLPYIGILAVYMLVRSQVLSSITFENKMEVINNSLMAAKTGMDRLATEIMMLGKYIYMLVIPYPLSWDYSYNQIPSVSFASVKAILSLLVYVAMGGYAIWGLIKNKSIYSFAILFYIITMFLTSNLLVKIGSSFGERFLFTPSVGYCMAVPLLLASVIKINPKHAVWNNKNTFYGVVGAILLIYTAIVLPRNREWADNFSLFKAGVITSPNSARAHSSLAAAYRDKAENTADVSLKRQYYALSLDEYRKSIVIYDKDPDTYYDMGVSFYEDGMQDSALKVYEKAVAVSPSYTHAYNNMGVICFNKKDFKTAIVYFMKAYEADTNNVQFLENIGGAYQNLGKAEDAIMYYNKVLKKDPRNAMVNHNMSVIYISSGMQYINMNQLDNAYNNFAMALKYDPASANAYGNIGVVYQKKGDYVKAREYYQKALSIDPGNKVFMDDMAKLDALQKSQNKPGK